MTTPSGNTRSARDVVIWIILAICAGVWLGTAARIAMRLIALDAGLAAGFSSGGSLEVILFGATIGMPIALLVWACRNRWPLPFCFGTIAGLALFVILTIFQPPAARSALAGIPDNPFRTALLFAAVFVSYGAVLDVVWAGRRSRTKPSPASSGPPR